MPVTTGPALLLGRERDIAELEEALGLAAQGSPQVVLIGGDAGIGKSTLVAHLERRACELGFTVATGHGLDLEAAIAFAPVVEALRSLVGGVEDLPSRPSAGRLLTLLDADAPRTREALHVVDDLTAAALEAAAAGPVLLTLEDMHWADRSTQDFAAALSRTARGRLLLVLTFRSDDLHRRHPFRRTLTEISRAPGSRRIDLAGLDRDSIAGIAAAHTDEPPDPSMVDSVMTRSEGNPLYAEEILAANQQGFPDHLSDLLLARIDALDEGPRTLLRVASVNGTRLDTETLADLAGLDQPRTEGYLRGALDANLLRQTGGYLEFRHPLLREAAYDDLMPDERTRTHAKLAEILGARVDAEPNPGVAALSRLAFHWNAAHDLPHTLAASVRAGLAAKRLGAAEALTQFERALSLWDRVPNARAVAGRPRAEILLLLGEAAVEQGDDGRGYTLVRAAVDMLEPNSDRLLASRVYTALGVSDVPEATVGRQEAIRRAVEYAGDSPTEELARALSAQSMYLWMHGRFADSVEAAARAIDAARSAGSVKAELDALTPGSISLFYLGHVGDALARLERAVAVARKSGLVGDVVAYTGELAMRNNMAGRVDRGLAVAGQGFEEGLALGLPAQAAACGATAVQALVWRGRFDEAEQQLEELGELGLPESRAALLLARGDADEATPPVRETAASRPADWRSPGAVDALAELQLAAMFDDWPCALETARSYLAQMEDTDSPLRAAAVARIGLQALSLGRSTPGVATDELQDLSARQLASAQGGLTDEWRPTYPGVQLALAEAYAARYAGEPAVVEFQAATSLAEPFGAYFALEPRLNLAQELLEHGGRDEGRELLVECWRAANDMGARELKRRAIRLATRTRVSLPQSAAGEGLLSRLTPREREVLDLLATGATNKTIATSLFVTEKTASVHVSNILAKLSVANRGEAAALARHLVG